VRLGLGCAPLGGLYAAVSEEDARATIDAAWDAGIRFFDVAPLYGEGLSEQRLGAALADRPRDEYVLSTKVGRLIRDGQAVFDFSRDGVLRSLDTIAAWEPERLALTHFGTATDAQAQLDRCRSALHEEAQLVAEHDQDGLVAAVEARVRAELGDDAESFLQAIPPHHIYLGLDRWRKKFSDAPVPPRSA
jgi:D-threo-aldose 1-dehydrogenase